MKLSRRNEYPCIFVFNTVGIAATHNIRTQRVITNFRKNLIKIKS